MRPIATRLAAPSQDTPDGRNPVAETSVGIRDRIREGAMCTMEFVDEATKKKIAAYSAKFRQATASPFGSRD